MLRLGSSRPCRASEGRPGISRTRISMRPSSRPRLAPNLRGEHPVPPPRAAPLLRRRTPGCAKGRRRPDNGSRSPGATPARPMLRATISTAMLPVRDRPDRPSAPTRHILRASPEALQPSRRIRADPAARHRSPAGNRRRAGRRAGSARRLAGLRCASHGPAGPKHRPAASGCPALADRTDLSKARRPSFDAGRDSAF